MRYSICLLFFLFPLLLLAEEPVAWINFLSGEVYCSNEVEYSNCFRYKSDDLVPVYSGFKLFAGDRVHVKQGSKADIQFKSGSIVRQMEGQVDINENGLDSGAMSFKAFFKITKQAAGKIFKVNSNTATVGVRGTEFLFKSEGKEDNQHFSLSDDGIEPGVYVSNGEVEVSSSCFLGLFCKDPVTLGSNEQVIFDQGLDKQTINSSIKAKINSIKTSQDSSSNEKSNSGCIPCSCW
ncbi:MAG: FecR domain-containing protein [Leptospiraceae bacterium]|nr:FecR domain-containing protein [Leptospiraceae bacterium]MCP5495147.1 FecR domain-containing protein [Leptospiraceae bacterium]